MENRGASVIVLAFLVASVSGRTATRISGGNNTQAENVPYQVAIVKAGNTTLRCGGALIRPNFVLTSAYCASLGNASDTQIMVGNNNLTRESPSQFVNVQDIRIHEGYDPESRQNDLALLKLTNDLRIQEAAVDTINIKQSAFPVTEICNLTGWGSSAWNGKSSGLLQRLELSAVNYVICSWVLRQTIEVGQFCAGGKEGENACFLDEGDPLVCNGELAGIMSHSFNCGKNKKPSVYTEVYQYRDWIDTTIEPMDSVAVTSLSSYISIAMPVGLVSYWKSRA